MTVAIYSSLLNRSARAGAAAVSSIGAVVLLGWLANAPVLKSLLPGLAAMKINTAVAFLVCGAALWLVHTSAPGSLSLRLSRALSIGVAVIGGLTLLEAVLRVDLGLDQLLLPDRAGFASFPGRMSPVTALNFVFIGLSMYALRAPQAPIAANWLAVPPLFLAALTLVGYAYGVISLYELVDLPIQRIP